MNIMMDTKTQFPSHIWQATSDNACPAWPGGWGQLSLLFIFYLKHFPILRTAWAHHKSTSCFSQISLIFEGIKSSRLRRFTIILMRQLTIHKTKIRIRIGQIFKIQVVHDVSQSPSFIICLVNGDLKWFVKWNTMPCQEVCPLKVRIEDFFLVSHHLNILFPPHISLSLVCWL